MIKSKKMIFVKEKDGISYYLFKPSLFKLYYKDKKGRKEPSHRHSIGHLLHMMLYVLDGGYRILYATNSADDSIAAYIIFIKSKDKIVRGSSKEDFYTVFLWTYPEFRLKGLATKLATVMLHDLDIQYRYFYKTIDKDNWGSIKVAEKNGFLKFSDANKVGLAHKIIPVREGKQYLYRFENNKHHQ